MAFNYRSKHKVSDYYASDTVSVPFADGTAASIAQRMTALAHNEVPNHGHKRFERVEVPPTAPRKPS